MSDTPKCKFIRAEVGSWTPSELAEEIERLEHEVADWHKVADDRTKEMLRLREETAALLDALKEARDYVLDYGSESSMAPVVERIDAAIAKAGGR